MTAPATSREQTADALVVLLRYLETWAPHHAELVPAFPPLQRAARCYRDGDADGAYEAAASAFRMIQQARALTPTLPVP